MMRPAFDIALSRPLAVALVESIEEILAEDRAEDPLSKDYVDWANKCLSQLRAGDDGYVALDEYDMGTLDRDVLPEFLGRRNRALHDLVEGDGDKESMLALIGEMTAASELMSRLHRAANYDIFDENWKGDRP